MEKKIIDKYEIIEQIGEGGMSKVYKVRDIRLQKYWALKEIDLSRQLENRDIFENSIISEMELLKKLEHPALPRIVDYFNQKTKIYIIIDYIEGETLKEKIEKEGRKKEEIVIEWALQLCDILKYLHDRKIIYRDLKPSNIMINTYGNLKLIDFGTARIYKENDSEDTVYFGTRGYAAPEQFGGKGQTDARTDIYSLGVTIYYLLNGKKPTYTVNEEVAQNYSETMRLLIERCIQIDPMDRFQNCEELKKELLECKNFCERPKEEKIDLERTVVLNQGVELFLEENQINVQLENKIEETICLEQSNDLDRTQYISENTNINQPENTKKSTKRIIIVGSIAGLLVIAIVIIAYMLNNGGKVKPNTSKEAMQESIMPSETAAIQETEAPTPTPTLKPTPEPTKKETKKPIQTKKPIKTKKPVQTETPVTKVPVTITTKAPVKTKTPVVTKKPTPTNQNSSKDSEVLDDDTVVEVID